MTEHLPECEAYRDECGGGCICHHVRACEQRVFQEQIAGRQYDMVLGYQRGLGAARRALQLLPKGGMGLKAHQLWRDARAAIDALREKP